MKKLITFAAILFFTTGAYAQNVMPGGKETIKIKGFISATAFLQDQVFKFANGQDAEWAVPPQFTKDKWFNGMDVRNSRLTMVFNGPAVENNWKLGGVLEFDMFGGFNGSGAFSAQQLTPRLRLAYMDIVHKNLRIRLGQAWSPLFGNVPVSLSHIAFPLGYGSAGFVGWRFPGIYFYLGLSGKDAAVKTRLDLAFFTGSWSGPGSNINFFTAGNAGTPQMEVRMNFKAKSWSAYIVGHYDQKDLAGVNVDAPDSSLTGLAGEFGAKLHSGNFLLQGNIYFGKNIGQQFAAITQIQKYAKDLKSVGGWVQVGYNFTKKWSAYVFYGNENINKNEAVALFASPRTGHNLYNFMLKYQMGPFAIGTEWLYSKLTYGANDATVDGNQFSLSGLYKF